MRALIILAVLFIVFGTSCKALKENARRDREFNRRYHLYKVSKSMHRDSIKLARLTRP